MKSESRTPWQAAHGLADAPDLVFLDCALPRPGAVSLVAAGAEEVVVGDTEADWHRLQAAIAARSEEPGGTGIAAGHIEYEGRFRFAFYREAFRFAHDTGEWDATPPAMASPPVPAGASIDFQPETSREAYEAQVRRAQEYIAAGDIYQVNLARRFSGRWSAAAADALAFYARLRAASPAPYGALLRAGGRFIASASPELFLEMRGRGIRTRPIKGTRARQPGAAADAAAALELSGSPKERAELVMITDLERNDLGRVCDYGSVEVREMLALERYAQVHHLVSTVTGRLRAGVGHVAALRACFPGGSITGAPKRRAMEIIRELEAGPRGVYTGAIGYFGFDGTSVFNIAIRTAVLEPDGLAHFHTGAGIVADSTPAREWEETLWKARGLLAAGDTRLP